MKNVKKLILNTAALTATSLAMKTVAVLYNVFLTDKIGTAGIGLFTLVMTVYAFIKTLGSSGLSLAGTRLSIDERDGTKHHMRSLVLLGAALGTSVGVLLYFGADLFASLWLSEPDTAGALRILSFSLPFVAMSACLGGYYTAVRRMGYFAAITFTEQIFKVILTVFLVSNSKNNTEAVEGISFAILLSEMFSFTIASVIYLLLGKERKGLNKRFRFLSSFGRIAVPEAVGAWVRSALRTAEHLLIPIGLKKSGVSQEKALASYGALQGMALPVLLYPSSLLASLSGLLVPEIAESSAENKNKHIRYIINRVISNALIFSIGVFGIMYVFSDHLSYAVYGSAEAAGFIRIIAPLIPIMYLDITVDGMLKGLDMQMSVMGINIIDSFLCVILVILLVPMWSVDGYVLTIYIAEIVNFILSYICLFRKCPPQTDIRSKIIKPLIAVLAAVTSSRLVFSQASLDYVSLAFCEIALSIVIYISLLLIFKCFTKEEMGWFMELAPKRRERFANNMNEKETVKGKIDL
ncbi:MAG: hypothetical protein E7665_05960 [Ruminococcaceae bacterium]|nr:hypothetical protein [Oscillospiraceae bacterium]